MVGYVTLEEADSYVASHYTNSNSDRILWDALDDDSKSVYLLQSVEAIDMLDYTSYPTSVSQSNAFPRSGETTIPTAVKSAQIENALRLAREEDLTDYERMSMLGITSYSIGNFKETFGSKGPTYNEGIVSTKAMKLLAPYTRGGFHIL